MGSVFPYVTKIEDNKTTKLSRTKHIYQKLKYSKLNLRKYILCCEEKQTGSVYHDRAPTLQQNAVEFEMLII